MTTPAPPYVYPRQKPTTESGDEDGHILLRRGDGQYRWAGSGALNDGDVWVPACSAFFDDWAPDVSFDHPNYRRCHANRYWAKTPDKT